MLTNGSMSSEFSYFKFVILREILGKERRQITFKVIAMQSMVLLQSRSGQSSGILSIHQELMIKSADFQNIMIASHHELPFFFPSVINLG